MVVAKTPGLRLYEQNGFRLVKRVEQERKHCGWEELHVSLVLVRDAVMKGKHEGNECT